MDGLLNKLFDEIIGHHWTYLEIDGNEKDEKLLERQKVENFLQQFLSIVSHDRKFILPEMGDVLKRTVFGLANFSPHNAMIGFESISQYANNLFAKPWRKEFRLLKMYSGYYQHEINENLLDAEKLFEAMGYRRLSNEILMLDEPICPDQVANVSRDAMAAYVECRMMLHIHVELKTLGATCTYQDVYAMRELFPGSVQQSVRLALSALKERRLGSRLSSSGGGSIGGRSPMMQPPAGENCYAQIGPPSQLGAGMPTMTSCSDCPPFSMGNYQTQIMQNSCGMQFPPAQPNVIYGNLNGIEGGGLIGDGGGGAIASVENRNMPTSYPLTNYQDSYRGGRFNPHQQQSLMSHSRSLEHYSEPASLMGPHRHSFDHQPQGCNVGIPVHHYQQNIYESPYDCVGGLSMGGSSASYAAVPSMGNNTYAYPYNVSGNRGPLPYGLTSQFGPQYAPMPPMMGGYGAMPGTYNTLNHVYGPMKTRGDCHVYPPFVPPAPANFGVNSFSTAEAPLIDFDTEGHRPIHQSGATVPPFPYEKDELDYAHEVDRESDRKRKGDRERERVRERENERKSDKKQENRNSRHFTTISSSGGDVPHSVGLKDAVHDRQRKSAVPVTSSASQAPPPNVGDLYGGNSNNSSSSGANHLYACAIPKSERMKVATIKSVNTPDLILRNSEFENCDNNGIMKKKELTNDRCEEHERKSDRERQKFSSSQHHRQRQDRGNRGSSSYESVTIDDDGATGERSPTQSSKNRDGMGSFEMWDYVYRSIDRANGREGPTVKGIDLSALNLVNRASGEGSSADKRRSSYVEPKPASEQQQLANGGVGGNSDKSKSQNKREIRSSEGCGDNQERTVVSSKFTDKSNKLEGFEEDRKSSKTSGPTTKAAKNTSDNKNSNGTINNGNGIVNNIVATAPESLTNKRSHHNAANSNNVRGSSKSRMGGGNSGRNGSNAAAKGKTPSSSSKQGVSLAGATTTTTTTTTQVIVFGPTEWSCPFCTFLNPNTKRICEMCCRSKDFDADATTVSKTPTCV